MTRRFVSVVAIVLPSIALVASLAGCDIVQPVMPVGPPLVCQGIPAQTCQQIVADARLNAGPGVTPVSIRAACLDPQCTVASGNVEVDVVYSDGRRDSYAMGWAGAEPEPAIPGGPPQPAQELPVEPVCIGIPQPACDDQALATLPTDEAGGVPQDIVNIVVRCTTTCSAGRGEGETVVTQADGSTTTASWAYEGSAPD